MHLTPNTSAIRIITKLPLSVAGTLRQYYTQALILNTPIGKFIYGNYDIIGPSTDTEYQDMDTLPPLYKPLLDLYSAMTLHMTGRILRVRQSGPHSRHFYYTTIPNISDLTPTKRTNNESINTSCFRVHQSSQFKTRYFFPHSDGTGFKHVRKVHPVKDATPLSSRQSYVPTRRLFHSTNTTVPA